MSVDLLAMSHSPLLESAQLDSEVEQELEAAFKEARRFVQEVDPQLVVSFAPDHYNGFFYRLMPPFCVGLAATSVGDYGSQSGPLDVPGDLARDLAEHVLEDGIDLAVSLEMEVDHGGVQPMEILYGDIRARPLVPVFVNSVAAPFVPMARVRALGESVGRFLADLDQRVLVISSGGLSHDPPVPRIDTATPSQRDLLLGHVEQTEQSRAARQQRVIDTARAFAAGEADIQDLAPDWDRHLLEVLASGDLSEIDGWSAQEMARAAGNSAHEVRTWVAGYAAMSAAGAFDVTYSYYRPIRELIAGFAVTTVRGTRVAGAALLD